MCVLLYDKFTSLKMGDDPSWGIVLMDILTYFLLFSLISVFHFEASALNWGHDFHRVTKVWKFCHVRHCTYKLFSKIST